jgi:hypothetical protein
VGGGRWGVGKASWLCIAVLLLVSGCANRLPLSDREFAEIVRDAPEFSTAAMCAEGVMGRRELVSIADASMVNCDSSSDECSCFARLRWRWLSESGNEACPAGVTDSYGQLGRSSMKPWRLTRFEPLPLKDGWQPRR